MNDDMTSVHRHHFPLLITIIENIGSGKPRDVKAACRSLFPNVAAHSYQRWLQWMVHEGILINENGTYKPTGCTQRVKEELHTAFKNKEQRFIKLCKHEYRIKDRINRDDLRKQILRYPIFNMDEMVFITTLSECTLRLHLDQLVAGGKLHKIRMKQGAGNPRVFYSRIPLNEELRIKIAKRYRIKV